MDSLATLRFVLLLIVISSLTSFASTSSVAVPVPFHRRGSEGEEKQLKMVLGSRPPQCVNQCMSCRPCRAALVTPAHPRRGFQARDRGDESYYLLSWKCKCGDKYFHP